MINFKNDQLSLLHLRQHWQWKNYSPQPLITTLPQHTPHSLARQSVAGHQQS